MSCRNLARPMLAQWAGASGGIMKLSQTWKSRFLLRPCTIRHEPEHWQLQSFGNNRAKCHAHSPGLILQLSFRTKVQIDYVTSPLCVLRLLRAWRRHSRYARAAVFGFESRFNLTTKMVSILLTRQAWRIKVWEFRYRKNAKFHVDSGREEGIRTAA